MHATTLILLLAVLAGVVPIALVYRGGHDAEGSKNSRQKNREVDCHT